MHWQVMMALWAELAEKAAEPRLSAALTTGILSQPQLHLLSSAYR